MTLKNAHPADVIAALQKSGSSLTTLAKAEQLHHSTLSHALRRCIPKANSAIASHLGKSLHELWPMWFDDKGHRRRDPSRKAELGKSQFSQPQTDKRKVA